MQLAGKKVVVVGGSSGIGLATAELAKAEGAEVIIASRSAEKLKAAADETRRERHPYRRHQRRQRRQFVPAMRPGRSRGGHRRAAQDRSVQVGIDGRRALDHGGQVLGRLARRARGRYPRRRLAHAGVRLPERAPRPNSAIVGAANGALESLTRALALELAPVRVNCVSPGIIDTPIRAAMPEAARRDMLAKVAAALPVGRVGAGRGYRAANPHLHDHRLCLPARSSISTAAPW